MGYALFRHVSTIILTPHLFSYGKKLVCLIDNFVRG